MVLLVSNCMTTYLLYLVLLRKFFVWGIECVSMVEHLPSTLKAPGLILGTAKQNQKKKKKDAGEAKSL